MEVLQSHYFHIPYPGALGALGECGQALGLRWKPEAPCQATGIGEREKKDKRRERARGGEIPRLAEVREYEGGGQKGGPALSTPPWLIFHWHSNTVTEAGQGVCVWNCSVFLLYGLAWLFQKASGKG